MKELYQQQADPITQSFLLKLASQHELPHVNQNNLHAYSPYFFDYDKTYYVLDENWYNTLTEDLKAQIKQKFTIGEIRTVQYPHPVHRAYQYWQIYTWYNCEVYDFSKYAHQIASINKEQIHLVKFQDNKERAEFSQLFFKQNPKIEGMQRLNKQLESVLQKKTNNGYFVKLSQRSGKNQIKLFPARTLEDVYKNLIYSNDVKKQIYSSSGILLREWKNFSNGIEFRVHVYSRRMIGISLQYYQKKVDFKAINYDVLVKLLTEGIKKIKFANSFVIDVMFINNEAVWFLEFNPYGVYAASRSAMFSHQQLLQLEQQGQPPVIKILQK